MVLWRNGYTFLFQQKEDLDSVAINHGPYSLAQEFVSFQVLFQSWFKMTTKQKFHAAKMPKESKTNVPIRQTRFLPNFQSTC